MPISQLTHKEKNIYNLIIQGLSNAEIAKILCIEVVTVKTHINMILKKLGFKRRYQLMAEVIRELKTVI